MIATIATTCVRVHTGRMNLMMKSLHLVQCEMRGCAMGFPNINIGAVRGELFRGVHDGQWIVQDQVRRQETWTNIQLWGISKLQIQVITCVQMSSHANCMILPTRPSGEGSS